MSADHSATDVAAAWWRRLQPDPHGTGRAIAPH